MNERPPGTPELENDGKSSVSRRAILSAAGVAAGGAVLARVIPRFVSGQASAAVPRAPTPLKVPDDPSIVPGVASELLAPRAPFENPPPGPLGVTTGSTCT